MRILKRQHTYKVIKTVSCTEAFNKSVIISAGPLYLQVPHPQIQPNEIIWGKKNSRKKVSKTKIWICHAPSNYLHSIYIVFTTIYTAFTLDIRDYT